jgi:hypothetical protein
MDKQGMDSELRNKVAESGLITINLEHHILPGERFSFDLKPFLFKELILKEQEFRAALKEHDWTRYQDAHVAIWCSNDAIIPVWAYMLVTVSLAPYAATSFMGTPYELERSLMQQAINAIDPEEYRDKMIVIKGCGEGPVPDNGYVEITKKLMPVAKSVMYGEPCATVPLYKKSKL